MQKFKFLTTLLAGLVLFLNVLVPNHSYAQQFDSADDYEYEYADLKSLFVDIGFGSGGVSMGLGFRYWVFGASIGLSGFSKELPDYDRYSAPLRDPVVDIERYTTLIVTMDGYYFYDFNEQISVFGNIGYAFGTDTLLARKPGELDNRLYRYRTESISSITYGAGVQYFTSQWLGFGAGYHSRRGVYAQINYFWL